MMKNVGGIDKVLRVLIGAGLVVYALTGGPAWAYIGILPLLSGVTGFCPMYCPLKLSTAGKGSCCGGGSCSRDKQQ